MTAPAPGAPVRLRRLGPDDWPTYRTIRLAMLREAPGAFATSYDDAVAWDEAAWRRRLGAGCTLLAEAADAPVGSVTCWVDVPGAPPHVAELGAMYVAPPARGRGVGELLVRAVLREAAEQGREVVRLEVALDNPAARALYERIGFVDTGIRHLRPGRSGVDDAVLERPVGS